MLYCSEWSICEECSTCSLIEKGNVTICSLGSTARKFPKYIICIIYTMIAGRVTEVLPSSPVSTKLTCIYQAHLYLPSSLVSTKLTCIYQALTCIYQAHLYLPSSPVSTNLTCIYQAHLYLPSSLVSTKFTCISMNNW